MARRLKYSVAVVRRICKAIEQGATYQRAAESAGVHRDTLDAWRKAYPAFSDMLRAAESQGILACLGHIHVAANEGDWRAAAWILEHRHPQEYGRVVQEQQHSGRIEVEFVNDWRVATRGERGESEAE